MGVTVVYEQGPASWGGYVPALPGLGVAGETRDEVEQLSVRGSRFIFRAL
jgi:predicted RNase H-like HicB family nuclease